MDWPTQRAQFRACIEGVAEILSGAPDYTIPAIGTWDLAGLVGHFLRAVRTPLSYLELPTPDGPPLVDAAAYVCDYLEWRSEDTAAADESVAQRGIDEFPTTETDVPGLLASEAERLGDVLATHRPDRLITTRFGPMRLADYMRTRSMEVAIHGLDIARALDTRWEPPTALTGDVLSLLGEIALARGAGPDLLLVLSGRTLPERSSALPILV